jgi:hypothetical protein
VTLTLADGRVLSIPEGGSHARQVALVRAAIAATDPRPPKRVRDPDGLPFVQCADNT